MVKNPFSRGLVGHVSTLSAPGNVDVLVFSFKLGRRSFGRKNRVFIPLSSDQVEAFEALKKEREKQREEKERQGSNAWLERMPKLRERLKQTEKDRVGIAGLDINHNAKLITWSTFYPFGRGQGGPRRQGIGSAAYNAIVKFLVKQQHLSGYAVTHENPSPELQAQLRSMNINPREIYPLPIYAKLADDYMQRKPRTLRDTKLAEAVLHIK